MVIFFLTKNDLKVFIFRLNSNVLNEPIVNIIFLFDLSTLNVKL